MDKILKSYGYLPSRKASPPLTGKKRKGSPYSITERRVPKLIPVPGSQPAGDVSHKPGGRMLRPISLLGEQRHDGCEQFA